MEDEPPLLIQKRTTIKIFKISNLLKFLVFIVQIFIQITELEGIEDNRAAEFIDANKTINSHSLVSSHLNNPPLYLSSSSESSYPFFDLNASSITKEITTTTTTTTTETETDTIIQNNNKNENNCTEPAINEFPNDGFTKQQRRQGWILIHIIFVIYCCWLLAVICDDYFIPVMKIFCISFNMKTDVIGATLMAAATSSSELFVNCVGTFITKSDIGIGTIVGSAVFNVLAVPACCGLFARKSFKIDWWPITRDCLMYCIAVFELIIILFDGKVMWYEALILILSYFVYVTVICCNNKLSKITQKLITKFHNKKTTNSILKNVITETTPLLINSSHKKEPSDLEMITNSKKDNEISFSCDDDEDFVDNPWICCHHRPRKTNGNIIILLLRWPITFILWLTIPNCRKWPRLHYLTLISCIIWIGIASYLVSFFTTIIGDTFNIPDSVMGITILAIGMSIPEAVSSIIVTKQGHCEMGICNSLGSNIFDILLCLGIPWFIRTIIATTKTTKTTTTTIKETKTINLLLPTEFVEEKSYWISINSSGLIYSVASLLITIFGFYITFLCNKFELNRNIGIIFISMYVGYIIVATAIEMNYFFNLNEPICEH